jgi:hypothetical protein
MVDNRQGERNYPVRAQTYFRARKFMKTNPRTGKIRDGQPADGHDAAYRLPVRKPAANVCRAVKTQIPASKGFKVTEDSWLANADFD